MMSKFAVVKLNIFNFFSAERNFYVLFKYLIK